MRRFALALVLAVTAADARPLAKVQETGELRVTVYQDYRPFSWRENGKPIGIDVDIAQALADALHVRLSLFELRADDDLSDDLRNGVWKGTVLGDAPGDLMLHVPYDRGVERNNERIALVAPYHVDALALFVDPAEAASAADLSFLKTEKAAVAVGTGADYALISAHNHAYLASVMHERTLVDAAARFERGDVAAFYGEESAGEALARAGKRAFTIAHPQVGVVSAWTVGAAVRSDSRDLGAEIERAMDRIAHDGTLKAIFAAYRVDWRKPEATR